MQKLDKNINQNMKEVALKAFFNIIKLWKINTDDALILLGRPGRSTYFKWKKGDISNISHDIISRISYIIGIYKALQILFANSNNADAWIRKENTAFAGQTALERMLAGDVTDLSFIRQYLDNIRGGDFI